MQYDQTPTQDLLADEFYYERASSGKRLANYLIDIVVFYLFIFVFAFVIAYLAPDILDPFVEESPGFNLLDRLVSLILYGLFMSLVEIIFKGKSVGKFITKTRAVNLDGTPISAATAFGRGFSRAVPFCAFSALGDVCNPWQDRWTNTIVINDNKRI